MAEIIKVYLNITINDENAPGMPIILEQSVDEIQHFSPYEEAADGNDTTFSAIPVGEIGTVQFFLQRNTTQALGTRVEGGEAGNTALRLSSDGLLLLIRCSVSSEVLTNNNNSGAVSKQTGFAGGT